MRRWGVLVLTAAVGLGVGGPAAAAPAPPVETGTGTTAGWRGDVVLRGPGVDQLDRPTGLLDRPARGLSARAPARARYALSYVVVPIRGTKLGFSKAGVRAMTNRVAARMRHQTDGRISFGLAAYAKAPKVSARLVPCNLDVLDEQYRQYGRHRRNPPPGFRDTIVVYLTPARYSCSFAGIAYLGGSRVYLNGLDLDDPQRLQDWITAHELGHTLGMDHAASFWPRAGTWEPGQLIPELVSRHNFAEYGDYLDVMGQPPRGGWRLPGTRFGSWLLDGLDLLTLGVLTDANAPTVRTSGTYRLNRLSPVRSDGRLMLAIPVRVDGSRTAWVLEYRPQTLNAALQFPSPWSTRAYGVRLLQLGHGSRYRTILNKVFHRSSGVAAYDTLPTGTNIRLGGGAVVRVNSADSAAASVTVTLP